MVEPAQESRYSQVLKRSSTIAGEFSICIHVQHSYWTMLSKGIDCISQVGQDPAGVAGPTIWSQQPKAAYGREIDDSQVSTKGGLCRRVDLVVREEHQLLDVKPLVRTCQLVESRANSTCHYMQAHLKEKIETSIQVEECVIKHHGAAEK